MTDSPVYKYYEVEIGNSQDPGGDTDNICIRGIRKPTKKEAAVFLAEDMKTNGCDKVLFVGEISYEDACRFYDMEDERTFPVFGVDTPQA